RRRILAAHVDAAVGVIADPEFGAQPEVVVRLPSDQEGGAGTGSRLDGAIARGPVGVADNVEVIEAVAAIDESDGAVVRVPAAAACGEGEQCQSGKGAKRNGFHVMHSIGSPIRSWR